MLRKEQSASPFLAMLFSVILLEKLFEYVWEDLLSLSCLRRKESQWITFYARNHIGAYNFSILINGVDNDKILQIILQRLTLQMDWGGKHPRIKAGLHGDHYIKLSQKRGGEIYVLQWITFVIFLRLCENICAVWVIENDSTKLIFYSVNRYLPREMARNQSRLF